MMGIGGDVDLTAGLEQLQASIKEVSVQFRNPVCALVAADART